MCCGVRAGGTIGSQLRTAVLCALLAVAAAFAWSWLSHVADVAAAVKA